MKRFTEELGETVIRAGSARSTSRRRRYARSTRVSDLLEPETANETCPNFLSLMGGRVCELNPLTHQKQMASKWGTRYKATWEESRRKLAPDDKAARRRDAALSSIGA